MRAAEGQIRIVTQGATVRLEFNTSLSSGAEMHVIIANVGSTTGFSAADFTL